MTDKVTKAEKDVAKAQEDGVYARDAMAALGDARNEQRLAEAEKNRPDAYQSIGRAYDTGTAQE